MRRLLLIAVILLSAGAAWAQPPGIWWSGGSSGSGSADPSQFSSSAGTLTIGGSIGAVTIDADTSVIPTYATGTSLPATCTPFASTFGKTDTHFPYACTNTDTWSQILTASATSTSGFGFVVDEDDMASNSATKVPTQQSVKAYVDASAGGGNSGPRPNTKRWSYCAPGHTTSGSTNWFCVGMAGPYQSASGGSAGDTAASATTGATRYVTTGGVSGNYATLATMANVARFSRNPRFEGLAYLPATTSERVWIGLSTVGDSTVAASDDPTGDIAAFRYSTNASDTTWKCVTNDNSGGGTISDSSVTVDTSAKEFAVVVNSGTDVKFYIDGALVCTNSANLPTAASNSNSIAVITTLTSAGKTLNVGYLYIDE